MSKQKRNYVKPEMTFSPAGSPKYNELTALLKTEDTKSKDQENLHPPAIPK